MPMKKPKKPEGATPARAPRSGNLLVLEDVLGYNLRRAHAVQRQRFNAVFAPYRIRPVQLAILGLIFEKSRLKQSELARALDIKRANIVTLLDELECRNLILRRPERTDRRSRALELTPAGKRLTAELLDLHARLEETVIESLGRRERDHLVRLLGKFRKLQPAPQLDYDE
jgi:DNA-binding MarR family transcriptional regulator